MGSSLTLQTFAQVAYGAPDLFRVPALISTWPPARSESRREAVSGGGCPSFRLAGGRLPVRPFWCQSLLVLWEPLSARYMKHDSRSVIHLIGFRGGRGWPCIAVARHNHSESREGQGMGSVKGSPVESGQHRAPDRKTARILPVKACPDCSRARKLGARWLCKRHWLEFLKWRAHNWLNLDYQRGGPRERDNMVQQWIDGQGP
jgi:hypothetical protein